MVNLRRYSLRVVGSLMGLWVGLTLAAGLLLPDQLLHPPTPIRTEAEREARREALAGPGDRWTRHPFQGCDDAPLELHWLHRARPQGVVLYLHGFGDDAFGTLGYAAQLPDWDAAAFTFRGRDRDSGRVCTLGAKEAEEVEAAVTWLESAGIPRHRVVLAGVSQGAGVALLALARLEAGGRPLAGALLESPFLDLRDAARHHLRGALGAWEPLARGAERLALARAGHQAGFDPEAVSPLRAVAHLQTPLAFLAGDADRVTPLEGVQLLAERARAPLVIVAGAAHCEAGVKVHGGWGAWAASQMCRWRSSSEGGERLRSWWPRMRFLTADTFP